MKSVSIIGAGRVGKTIGKLMQKAGYKIKYVVCRSMKSAHRAKKFITEGLASTNLVEASKHADIVMLGVPDDKIKEICQEISREKGFNKNSVVLHFSGNYSHRILKSAERCGAYTASIHPLRSFASPLIAYKQFPGTFCIYDGDKDIQPLLVRIIKSIGGIPVKIDSRFKSLYHTSCVFASNYLITILYVAYELLKKSRIQENVINDLIYSLSLGTLINFKKKGAVNSLTGPIERADITTLKNHLCCLRRYPVFRNLYKHLAQATIKIARKKGSIDSRLEKAIKHCIIRYR